eukprot:Protomagalhaensia_wolfi_Nauph_80__4612@NODE_4768_length_508_cov_187_665245_g3847_i0_p1_GENE_NODE_4768_length_508_cov_187_665245_g3847_i0NODE_4768_length_508_cov_187_665245_g3847_i0_p1_ORF_typecomplete_len131_score4_08DUF778/PF05608_12/7_2e24VirE/PF05272_11/1e02VirE/PF05272_11/2_2_NODE_4768_length_508_cov_187_665245_g3847_i045437
MDIENNLYPYSIVWTSLPLITILIPLIGHTGVGDSRGTISDFAASYTIGRKRLVFGPVRRYWVIHLNEEETALWDSAVLSTNELYSHRTVRLSVFVYILMMFQHNIFTNNCHHHVATILNTIQYRGKTNW